MRRIAIIPIPCLENKSLQKLLQGCLQDPDVFVDIRDFNAAAGKLLANGWEFYWRSLDLEDWRLPTPLQIFDGRKVREHHDDIIVFYDQLMGFLNGSSVDTKIETVDLMIILPEGALLLSYFEKQKE